MKKFILLTAIACTATVSAVAPVMAQVTPSTSLGVSGTVAKSCTQPDVTPVGINGYDGSAAVSATSSINFKCTKNTTGTVKILTNTGSSTTGTLAGNGTSDVLNFTVAGDGSTALGTGISANQPVLGVPATVTVPVGQDVRPATYTGTIGVTVSY